MEIDDIAAIVKILNDNNLSHISFKKGDSKISVSKNINREIQIADSIDIAKARDALHRITNNWHVLCRV